MGFGSREKPQDTEKKVREKTQPMCGIKSINIKPAHVVEGEYSQYYTNRSLPNTLP